MNPWGFVVIGLGLLLIIMGVKGSYENVIAALTGHAEKKVPTSGNVTNTTAQNSATMPFTTIPTNRPVRPAML